METLERKSIQTQSATSVSPNLEKNFENEREINESSNYVSKDVGSNLSPFSNSKYH